MSMSNASETALLQLLFNNTDWANVGDAAGLQNSATAGSFYVALHTADPGEAGTQATSEATYTGYARVALTKASAWTDGGSSFTNAALIQFGACSAGSNAITHFAVVDTSSGAVSQMISGALSSTLNVSAGIQPQFAAGALAVTAD